ncbi:hypothetical protein LF599_15250 [Pseudodesulfovibrio thermohalotolerans]|uniref:SHOCT domain-containing protein n=1 Tax=Pseudodesulfovibrio thermohalotolerans TaxID=2880651 RepID=UPI0024428873|nr:hypothetical protein [Pseudodesulfovibrio thermohalotolerans]WFS62005.1 hypothetical protein LF599_15250 [Pseudodesulfovibrio thermohalotolerans]
MEFLTSLGTWCSGPGFRFGEGPGGWFGSMSFLHGGIVQFLVLGLIIYILVRLFHKPAMPPESATPEEILKRRYASGEIDTSKFLAMKDKLRNG